MISTIVESVQFDAFTQTALDFVLDRLQPCFSGGFGAHHELIAPFGVFKGPSGYFVIAVLQLQWAGLCAALNRPDLVDDPRFVDGGCRARHQGELIALIEAWAAGFPDNDAVIAVLERERVPAAPVLNPIETLDHPYFRARDMVREIDDPILGPMQVPGFPFKFSAQAEQLTAQAPLLGEHTEEILREIDASSAEDPQLVRSGDKSGLSDKSSLNENRRMR